MSSLSEVSVLCFVFSKVFPQRDGFVASNLLESHPHLGGKAGATYSMRNTVS